MHADILAQNKPKFSSLRQRCLSSRSFFADHDVDVFPPPLPLTRSHPSHRPFGVGQCQGWERAGVRAGLVVGTDYPPPLHPPSPGTIFSGRARGRGDRRGPYDALIFPAPSPTSPPQPPVLEAWCGEAGGWHPQSYLNNPHNAPAPTRTNPGTLSQ